MCKNTGMYVEEAKLNSILAFCCIKHNLLWYIYRIYRPFTIPFDDLYVNKCFGLGCIALMSHFRGFTSRRFCRIKISRMWWIVKFFRMFANPRKVVTAKIKQVLISATYPPGVCFGTLFVRYNVPLPQGVKKTVFS